MKVLIIEDELSASRRLKKMIQEIDPEITFLAVLESVNASIEWLSKEQDIDLIFMDIHLADGSSFEIFKEVEVETPVIFTTAYDEYAVEAFKVNSVDYLLKPIKKQELANSIEKFSRIHQADKKLTQINIQELLSSMNDSVQEFQKRILIKYGQHLKAIEISESAYFYVESRITFMKTHQGKNYPVDYNLDQLEEILNPDQFFRINRKFIINIDAIGQMFTYSKSRVKIELIPPTDSETIVSSERSARFKKWLMGKND